MKQYFAYVLLLKNNRYYYGYSSNLQRRIFQHRNGQVKSTKNRFVKLLYSESFDTKGKAIEREKFFKSGQGRDFIKTKIVKLDEYDS